MFLHETAPLPMHPDPTPSSVESPTTGAVLDNAGALIYGVERHGARGSTFFFSIPEHQVEL